MSIKAVAYIRISEEEKAAGYLITDQIDTIRNYCSQNGYDITHMYIDDGFSGDDQNRPELQEMLQAAEEKQFQVVVVSHIDRLSLSQSINLCVIREVFVKNMIDFVSIRDKINTCTQAGRDTINALDTFVSLERKQRRNKLLSGRTNRAKQGKWHGGGTEPIGYDYINGELTINEAEARQIRRVYRLYSEGCSMNEISRRMEGYKTKHGTWEHNSTITNVLDNPLYAGTVHFNNVNVPNSHAPIVDKKTDRLVKRRREKSLSFNHHQKDSKHLLSGIVYCANCGARYFPKKFPDGKYKYICYSRAKTNKKMVKDPNCRNIIIDKQTLENEVIGRILELHNNPLLLSDYIKKRTAEGGSSSMELKEEICNINRQINTLTKLRDKKQISEDAVKQAIDSLTIKRQNLMFSGKNMWFAYDIDDYSLEEFKLNLSEFSAAIESNNIKYCRHLLSLLLDRIEISEEKIIFQWAF